MPNTTQLTALYGSLCTFADHRIGESVKFHAEGKEYRGKILWVIAPGTAVKGGTPHGILYVVDAGTGFPAIVAPGEIVEGKSVPFKAILGSYGFPDSQLANREEAENLVSNLTSGDRHVKYTIDTDHGVLRVLSAHVEGDDVQGRVIAECEAVEEEH